MPLYLFVAKSQDPHGRPLPPLPSRHLERFLLYFPGPSQQAIRFAIDSRIGSWHLCPYDCHVLGHEAAKPVLLCCQSVLPPMVSAQHVAGGQPTGAPVAPRGQEDLDSPIDGMHFQKLGQGALPAVNADQIYGDASDGTYSDLVDGGRTEIGREL